MFHGTINLERTDPINPDWSADRPKGRGSVLASAQAAFARVITASPVLVPHQLG